MRHDTIVEPLPRKTHVSTRVHADSVGQAPQEGLRAPGRVCGSAGSVQLVRAATACFAGPGLLRTRLSTLIWG